MHDEDLTIHIAGLDRGGGGGRGVLGELKPPPPPPPSKLMKCVTYILAKILASIKGK